MANRTRSASSTATRWLCCIAFGLMITSTVCAYSPQSTVRRTLLRNAVAAAAFAAPLSSSPAIAADGILSAKYCAGGVGEGCDDRAEGNEFIKSLQEKSKANREANTREGLNAYYMKNYPDFFASLNPPRYLVKKSDGSFETYTDVELASLKKAGKIGLEVAKTMGGRATDMTQKPVMVLKE